MAAKRSKREYRKRGTGTIQRQADGTFIARTTDKSRSGRFSTRSEAEAALERWNVALGVGRNPNESRQTLRDFARVWLMDVCKPKVQPATLEFYTRHIGYLTAIIGGVPLEAVTTRDVEKAQAQLSRDGLSARSVNHCRAVLRNCLGVAKRWKLVPENVAADAPEWRVDDEQAPALTPAQVAALLSAVEDDRLCALYHVALTLGLRRGELLALRWSDVDFAAGVLRVEQTAKEGEGRHITVGVTKSRQARELPLPADLAARLHARQDEAEAEARHAQRRAIEAAGDEPTPLVRWNPDGYVFCSTTGTLILPSNFNRAFAKLRSRLGWPKDITPHSLRKTALTDLAAHGEAKAVQNIAGHADIDTTMRVYAGRRMAAMRAAVEAVERERRPVPCLPASCTHG